MGEIGEQPRITRRKFLKLAGAGVAGAAGTTLIASKLGQGQEPSAPTQPQESAEIIPQNEFITALELLGEGYKSTRLDAEGVNPEQEPPFVYDVKSQGTGFEGLDESIEQGGFFYLSGQRQEDFPRGANVSMQVSLLESADGSKKYIRFGIDNASRTDAGWQLDPTSVEYGVTFPVPPMGSSGAGSPITQKEAEEAGGSTTEVYAFDKPQLDSDRIRMWEEKGSTGFFIKLEDPEPPQAKNVIPGGSFIPTELRIVTKDSVNNTSVNFTATKSPAK